VESLELAMDVGLGLAYSKINDRWLGTEFETDDLLRMDYGSMVKAEKEASGIKTIDEARRRLNLRPIAGGSTVYLQHQDYPIEVIYNRKDVETAKPATAPAQIEAPDEDETPKYIAALLTKAMEEEWLDAA
jgi:hypothetical protein